MNWRGVYRHDQLPADAGYVVYVPGHWAEKRRWRRVVNRLLGRPNKMVPPAFRELRPPSEELTP